MVASSGKFPLVVLVVEDEPLLRILAVEVVEEAGFVALEASNADEAVILLQSRSDISVLFTDIDMPGRMDGLKLAYAVRGRWPAIKILLVSGQVRLQSSQLPSNSRFVAKPYRAEAMIEELRARLLIVYNRPRKALERTPASPFAQTWCQKRAKLTTCASLGARFSDRVEYSETTDGSNARSPDRPSPAEQSAAGRLGAHQPKAARSAS
jgi:two-component system, response regulator PdtaR